MGGEPIKRSTLRHLRHLIRPDPKPFEFIRAKGRDHCDVRRVPSPGNQEPTDLRCVVARVECVPRAAQIGLEPSREITGRIRRLRPSIAEIAGAVACRNVECPAEGDGEVRVVAANSDPFLVGLGSRPGCTRVRVAERTKSQIAWTRFQPGFCLPNSSQARSRSLSLSQNRLASRKINASSGNNSTGTWPDPVSTRCGRPRSLITASEKIRTAPAGAINRLHQLPKVSR